MGVCEWMSERASYLVIKPLLLLPYILFSLDAGKSTIGGHIMLVLTSYTYSSCSLVSVGI